MSSQKKKFAPNGKVATAGVKRPAPGPSSTASAHQLTPHPASKKAKSEPKQKFAPIAFAPVDEDDESDDDAAILALKAKLAKQTSNSIAEEDDFEVAEGAGDDEDDGQPPQSNTPPSEDEDEDMRDADESDDEKKSAPMKQFATPIKQDTKAKPASTPAAKSAPAPASAVKIPASSVKATPIKPSPALKPTTPTPATKTPVVKSQLATPAKATKATIPAVSPTADSSESSDEEMPPAHVVKQSLKQAPVKPAAATAAVKKPAAANDSETSESEDDSPPAKAPLKSAPVSKPTPLPASSSATSATVPKPQPKKVALGDSSESSDDDEPTVASALAARKPLVKKPTPLVGDASVNPPPKPAPKLSVAGTILGSSATYDRSVTRPPTAPHTGRKFTVSIALPGSIIGNAQSKELRTYVAGQIARAAATFNIDEIVVFAENGKQTSGGIQGNFEGATRSTDPDVFMARILQYLETPQYLRKTLFPKHVDLSNAGLLNPLDSPHHVRVDEDVEYREGVVVNRPVAAKKDKKEKNGKDGNTGGCWVNIGLKDEAFVPKSIPVGTRVTVHIPEARGSTTRKHLQGEAVAPSTPREKDGTFWGYTTRLAQSLSEVWSECPFKGGYDLSIGTSEHGVDCHAHEFALPQFNHAIIFFGGLAGLEEHIAADESIAVKKPSELFQLYINSVIGQGCRTIRTEEAVPITLSALYRHIRTNQPPTA